MIHSQLEIQQSITTSFKKQSEKLVKVVGKWNESDLDKYLLPHPLLGKMTLRELLFWMIYHNYHHLNNLKAHY